jgi:hypothetical protein
MYHSKNRVKYRIVRKIYESTHPRGRRFLSTEQKDAQREQRRMRRAAWTAEQRAKELERKRLFRKSHPETEWYRKRHAGKNGCFAASLSIAVNKLQSMKIG